MEYHSFQDIRESAENNCPETSELQKSEKWALEKAAGKLW